jgi:hypothetical protein
MSNLKWFSCLLAVLFTTWIIAYKTGRQVTDRWYAQHETCFSKEPIVFSPTSSFTPDEMTGTAYQVTMNNGGKTVVSIDYDGKVHFGKGMTPDKASREFWKKMGYDFTRCHRSKALR